MWARHENETVRTMTADNPHTSPETLAVLGADKDDEVRDAVLWHKRCPPETLVAFAQEGFDLKYVASHAACPPPTLALLASHKSPEVRQEAAANPNCPPQTLAALASDPNDHVRAGVVLNPACGAEALDVVRSAATSPRVRAAWAKRMLLGGQ